MTSTTDVPDAYTISTDGQSVTFTSASVIPAGGVTVNMNLYADVLDANNLYANWNTTYGNKTTNTTTVAAGHTYNFAPVGNYNPAAANVFGSYTSTYKSGSATKTLTVYSLASRPSRRSSPTSRWASTRPLCRSLTAPDRPRWPAPLREVSTVPLIRKHPVAVLPPRMGRLAALAAWRRGSRGSTVGLDPANYFVTSYNNIGTTNPYSTAFSYLTGTVDNPNDPGYGVGPGTPVTAFNQVQINGKWYSQIFMGTISFAVTGVSGNGTATITPSSMSTNAGNGAFWMEDGATYTANSGTINTLGVAITVSANSTSGGALSLSGPVGPSRMMVSGTTNLTFTLSNPGTSPLDNWNLAATAVSGTLSALSPASGVSLAASGGTAPSTTTYTAPSTPGIDTISGTATSTDNGGLSATSSATIDVVQNRQLTANSTVPLASANKGLLLNGTWNVTVSGPGDDTLNTKPVMTSGSFGTGGVTAVGTPGVSGTFTASGSNQNVALTFATSGTTPAITPSDLVSHGLIVPEGIGDTVTISGTVLPAGTIVGTATASNGGAHAYNNTFNGTLLESQVAAGQAYAGLSSTVTGVSGGPNNMLGTVATILAGTNNSGSPTTVGMTWRTRATDETAGTIQQPPMSYANKAGYLTSDVVNVTGIATSATSPYVLQMSFNPSLFASGAQNNFSNGWLYLGTLSGAGTGETWENAVKLDDATGSEAKVAQGEDWNTFISNNGGVGNLANLLGSWGVDTTNNVAWAVIDYNGTFAVVPEPGTLVLLLVAAGVLTPVIRRRWRAWKKS